MIVSADILGRLWPHDKLDRLLADPDVRAAVDAFNRAGRGDGRAFQPARGRDWAYAQGRSEPGFALLLVLRRRLLAQRLGRAA